MYRPYQTRAQIAMGDCYVLCGRSGVTWTAPPHIVHDVSSCSSPQDVARRRLPRTRSPSGSGRRYLGRTSFRGGPYRGLLLEPGRPEVSLRPFFLRTTSPSPGVEGGYLAQVHHLHVPLPKGPGTQAPRNLPPGPCGGGADSGLTLAVRPDIPSLTGLKADG